MFMNRESRKRF